MSSRLRRRGRHIGALLVAAERAFNDELVTRLHRRGFRDIRPSHGAVFANLDSDGTRVTVLAERAGMTKQSMGELVADLEEKGYVERRPDPHDRRARVVVPTARGIAVDRVADEIIERIEREYERRLGAHGLARLRASLERLHNP
jgi:DNA-binding MarR family transcriptional regulator